MPTHEKFEELCALGVSGELHEEELAELNEHLRGCSKCKALWADFEETYFILSAAAHEDPPPIPERMTQRFVARARSAGIPLTLQTSSRSELGMLGRVLIGVKPKSIASWAPVVMIVLAAASFFLGMRYQTARHPQVPTPVSTSQETPESGMSQVINEDRRLKEQLRDAQDQLATASAKLKRQQEALESSKHEQASLTVRITELKASNSALRENESRRNTKLEELEAELEKTRAKENADHAASLVTEAEVKNLRDKVAKLSFQLRLAQELDATLHEAHDLIVDRNVHVLNVFPEAGEDNRSTARGRIFYAEGKKLVFYAYDLTPTNKISAKPSFYLWGQTPGTIQKVVSLGKFQVDSEREGRWVLRVTDPRLLAHIDSVFVTEEPDKRPVTQPSGRRMLFRVLDTTASEP